MADAAATLSPRFARRAAPCYARCIDIMPPEARLPVFFPRITIYYSPPLIVAYLYIACLPFRFAQFTMPLCRLKSPLVDFFVSPPSKSHDTAFQDCPYFMMPRYCRHMSTLDVTPFAVTPPDA